MSPQLITPDAGTTVVPAVAILSGPKEREQVLAATVQFTFQTMPGDSQTQCSLDGQAYTTCSSPHAYPVSPGARTFAVRAVYQQRTGDPATRSFTVLPPVSVPQYLDVLSGNAQQGAILRRLPTPVAVRVLDSKGATVPGVLVRFTADQAGAVLSPTEVLTDANGRAQTSVQSGHTPGTLTITITVQNSSLSQTVSSTIVDDTLSRFGTVFIQNPSGPSDSELPEISRAAMAIFSWEACDHPRMALLKARNPRIKLFCYHDPVELTQTTYANRPYENSIIADVAKYDVSASNSWYLYAASPTEKACFWCAPLFPPMWLMNISDVDGAVFGGQRYHQYIADKMVRKLFTSNPYAAHVDGVLVDAGLRDAAWMHSGRVDINRNGIADSLEVGTSPFTHPINVQWRSGYEKILQALRAAKPGLQIITNQANEYFSASANGKQFEGIDNLKNLYGPTTWNYGAHAENTGDVQNWVESYLRPSGLKHNLLEVLSSPIWNETAVAMAALYDESRFLLGKNTLPTDPATTILLGDALGDMTKLASGLLVRSFRLATVLFNPTGSSQFYPPSGVTVPPYQGRVLAR